MSSSTRSRESLYQRQRQVGAGRRSPVPRRSARCRSCDRPAPRRPPPACASPADRSNSSSSRARLRRSPRRGGGGEQGDERRGVSRRDSEARGCCHHQCRARRRRERGGARARLRACGATVSLRVAQPRERSSACVPARAARAPPRARLMRGSKRLSSDQSAASSVLDLPQADAEAGERRGAEGRGLGIRRPQHRHAQQVGLELQQQIVARGATVDAQLGERAAGVLAAWRR